MASKRGERMSEKLRAKILREADPVGYMIRVASGLPVEQTDRHGVTHSTLPTAKQVHDANVWLGDRVLGKVKEVQVEHSVDEGWAAQVRAAKEKAESAALSLQRGGTPVEEGSGPPPVLVPPSQKSGPEKLEPVPGALKIGDYPAPLQNEPFQNAPLQNRVASARVQNPAAEKSGTKNFGDPPGPEYVPIDKDLIIDHDEILTTKDAITTSLQAADDADVMDEIVGGL